MVDSRPTGGAGYVSRRRRLRAPPYGRSRSRTDSGPAGPDPGAHGGGRVRGVEGRGLPADERHGLRRPQALRLRRRGGQDRGQEHPAVAVDLRRARLVPRVLGRRARAADQRRRHRHRVAHLQLVEPDAADDLDRAVQRRLLGRRQRVPVRQPGSAGAQRRPRRAVARSDLRRRRRRHLDQAHPRRTGALHRERRPGSSSATSCSPSAEPRSR
jgi:hypothetical protein